MYTISGIKYQKELESLPYFTKSSLETLVGKKGINLDKKMGRLIKNGYLIRLKNGIYTTDVYNRARTASYEIGYYEFLANVLTYPSYVSTEYVLSNYSVIPDAVYAITSITLKSPKTITNKLGRFIYRSIKKELFDDFTTKPYGRNIIKIATPAKALFDFLYLKKNITRHLKFQMEENYRINWDALEEKDKQEFERIVIKSESGKMMKILEYLRSKC